MARTASRFRRRVRTAVRSPVLAALLLAGLFGLGGAGPRPAGAADENPVVGKDELIGKLIPITGDPLERRSVDLRIEFGKNSTAIGEDARAQLRELGEALVSEALRDVPVGVYGHTDTGGPADFNRELSERRAQAVAAHLRELFALPEERFREVRGYGEERPRPDLPPTAPAQRRVEIVTFHKMEEDEPPATEEEPAAPAEAPVDQSDSGIVIIGGDSPTGSGSELPVADTPTDESMDEEKKGTDGIVVIE